jgi:glycerol-3-phosphate dehydrogenase (NAD(P)+)
MAPMTIAVLGAGAWGTALASLLAGQGHTVRLWARDPALAAALAETRENRRYLPGLRLPEAVSPCDALPAALVDAAACVVAVPSAAVRETAQAASFAGLVICAAKGLEKGSRKNLLDVIGEAWPAAQVALLSGPTFAVEIARGLPAAAVVASRDLGVQARAQDLLSCERFRVYTSGDVVGVAISGAFKNVIAIAAGCADGLGFGANARAALITRGLAEVGRLVERMGGNAMTVAGLAGLGDMVLTCTGELSRNRTVGVALGRGEPLVSVLERLGHVAEGVETAETAADLARAAGVDMPITTHVAAVLAGTMSAEIAVAALLSREVGTERG